MSVKNARFGTTKKKANGDYVAVAAVLKSPNARRFVRAVVVEPIMLSESKQGLTSMFLKSCCVR